MFIPLFSFVNYVFLSFSVELVTIHQFLTLRIHTHFSTVGWKPESKMLYFSLHTKQVKIEKSWNLLLCSLLSLLVFAETVEHFHGKNIRFSLDADFFSLKTILFTLYYRWSIIININLESALPEAKFIAVQCSFSYLPSLFLKLQWVQDQTHLFVSKICSAFRLNSTLNPKALTATVPIILTTPWIQDSRSCRHPHFTLRNPSTATPSCHEPSPYPLNTLLKRSFSVCQKESLRASVF